MPDERRLPVEDMLRDVDTVDPTDKDCHIMALVAEVKALARACALAYHHIDRYAPTEGDNLMLLRQAMALDALRPFVGTGVGRVASVYERPPSTVVKS